MLEEHVAAGSRERQRLIRLAAIGLTLALAPTGALTQEHATPPTILLLSSYRSTAPAVSEIEQALGEELVRLGAGPIDLQTEYLDLPDPSAASYSRRLFDLLRERYATRMPRVVVVVGVEALRFVLERKAALFDEVPVVFAAVTRASVEGLHPPAEVTGTYLRLEAQRTPEVALDLHPEARLVVFVSGSAPGDRENEAQMRGLVEARSPDREIVSLSGLPLEEQLRRLARLGPESVVIFVAYRADSQGHSTVASEVLRRVARASGAPVYGASGTWLGLGIVGGDLIDFFRVGRGTAFVVHRVLAGADPASIAPTAEAASRLMFDWRQLRRWGIDEARLPEGSEVAFREVTLWSQHRRTILGAVVLLLGQAVLIGALLVERRSRIGAEGRIREAERQYRTLADFTWDWVYWRRPDGGFNFVSPSCLRVTGHDAEEFHRHPALLDELVVDEDRARWIEHEEGAGRGPVHLEFRIRTAAGRVRWMDHVCAPVTTDEGVFLGVRSANRDVTERKTSEVDLRRAMAEIERLRERLEADNTYLREQVEPSVGFEGIVGRSDVLRYVLFKVQQVAPTPSSVLLLGETGVGKDLVAHAVHSLSPRRGRPLVKLNCAALPSALIESELFGHEKGAFTGAHSTRRGRFEIADGSTLLLDEIGELPLELQAKLLRVIQDGEFERVGGIRTLKTDVRLIAATNRRLEEEVEAGRFREDLWYRLNVFPITVPPLRQRPEDIPLLVDHFVEKHCRRLGRPVLQVSQATIQDLEAHDWPGNVRELEAFVERAVISSSGPALRAGEGNLRRVAPPRAGRPADGTAPPSAVSSGATTLQDLERRHIVATMERTLWRVEGADGAAAVLGLKPSTLRSRMRKLGISRPGRLLPEPPEPSL